MQTSLPSYSTTCSNTLGALLFHLFYGGGGGGVVLWWMVHVPTVGSLDLHVDLDLDLDSKIDRVDLPSKDATIFRSS